MKFCCGQRGCKWKGQSLYDLLEHYWKGAPRHRKDGHGFAYRVQASIVRRLMQQALERRL